jgi:peptide-methionine (S)-S-oxide reductase
VATSVGYSGGALEHPTYDQVCAGGSGHAEVVEVRFDPAAISLERLLAVFFSAHDPTTPRSRQYRSAIFATTPRQRQLAVAEVARRQAYTRKPILTEIAPAGPYWRAEEYHQRFYAKKRGAS